MNENDFTDPGDADSIFRPGQVFTINDADVYVVAPAQEDAGWHAVARVARDDGSQYLFCDCGQPDCEHQRAVREHLAKQP